jgi:hypothetical protein
MNRIQYGFSLKRNDIIRVFFRFISLNFLQWNKNGTQAVRVTMKAMSTCCENLPIVGGDQEDCDSYKEIGEYAST